MMKSSTQEDERNSAQYKGVRKRKWGKWVSEIRLPNSRERIWLGSYDSAEKAARAFDAASFCLRGKNAKFNFPDNPPDIPGGRRLSSQEIQAAAAKYANEEPHTEHNHHHHQQQQQQQQQHCSMDYVSPSSISDIPLDSTNMAMDWEFLDMLGGSSSSTSVSDFGVYSGMNDFPGEFLPPEHTVVDYGEENDAVFTQQSFLWNF